jgi:type III secretory pathway component EscU
MEETIERILSHPLLTVTLSLFCLLLLFAILKRLLKMILISLVLILLYFGYVHYFQDQYPLPVVDMKEIQEIKEDLRDWVIEDLNVSIFEGNRSRLKE